jgi:hypothetical protein
MCLLLAAIAMAATASVQPPAESQPSKKPEASIQTPRLVLSFYYPWYGTPTGPGGLGAGGKWVHWDGVDEKGRSIASSTHSPASGPYDSQDPRTLARHCVEAKEAGIDGFIASWWGAGTFEDKAVGPMLDACAEHGLKLSLYYETVPSPRTSQAVASEIENLLARHAKHPAFLKVGDRPVLFVYGRALGELPLAGWKDVIKRLGDDMAAPPLLIADRTSDQAAEIFDGLHVYNPAGDIAAATKKGESLDAWATRADSFWVNTARHRGRISCVTVIPGYDDTKIRHPGLKVERGDGTLYSRLWQRAVAANPDWVLVTSFNEWHEGSEIEPSDELGRKYLALTATMARKFKDATMETRPAGR